MNRLITVGKAVKDVMDKLTADWGATFRDPLKAQLATVANHRLVAGNVAVALDDIPEKRVVDLVHVGQDLALSVAAGAITPEMLKEMVLSGALIPAHEAGAVAIAGRMGRSIALYTTITPATVGAMRWRTLPGVAAVPVTGLDESLMRTANLVQEAMALTPAPVQARRVAVRRPR